MQLRARLWLAAPGAVIAVGLLAVAVAFAVTGRHADAAYTAAALVGVLAAWWPLARHLRRGELGCDRVAAAAVGADTLAAAISTAARWQTEHDTLLDRALGRAAAALKLSASPTPSARIAALTDPDHGEAAELRS